MIPSPSPNFDRRPSGQPVDMLVLHYTGMETAAQALERLGDKASKVSAHYMIGEEGEIHCLVDEANRAWHAGVALWRRHGDINGRSIGIELVNPGHEFGYRPFPEAQMAALEGLACQVLERHPIPARNVVGHSDVAPRRKTDPGELFDWSRLARGGIGLWPGDGQPEITIGIDPENTDDDTVARLLAEYGYESEDPTAAITAFQRHFRPKSVDGRADGETVRRLLALLERVA